MIDALKENEKLYDDVIGILEEKFLFIIFKHCKEWKPIMMHALIQ